MSSVEALFAATDALLDEVTDALTVDALRALYARVPREVEGPAVDFVRGRILKRLAEVNDPSPTKLRAIAAALAVDGQHPRWLVGGPR